jgi:hypothetical protein
MTDIVIDPFVLAYPIVNKDSNNFEEYIFRILDIKEIMDLKNVKLLISKNTSEILVRENNYPDWNDLKEALTNFGLKEIIQPKDVLATVQGILKSSEIEELTGLKEILFDHLEYDSEILNDRNQAYKEEMERLFLLFIVNQNMYGRCLMASTNERKIFIKGTIIDGDFYNESILTLPDEFEGEINTFSSIEKMFELLDPIYLWGKSTTKEQYIDSLNIYLYQRIGKFFDESNWTFGDVFFEKARRCGFLHEPSKIKSLLKSIADTLLEENLSSTHALRAGVGPSEPQLTRGSEKAWRKDIDYEYHLHYWHSSNSYEFASLGVHNDMYIPS